MPQDYFSFVAFCFGMFDMCQTGYSIHSNLQFSPYSEVIYGSTKFKLKYVYKEKWPTIQFGVCDLSFIFSFQCPRQ